MSNKNHQSIMDQVWAYTRILTITGGIAMCTFIFAGYVWMTSPGQAQNSLVENKQNPVVDNNGDSPIFTSLIDTNQPFEVVDESPIEENTISKVKGGAVADNVIAETAITNKKLSSSKAGEVFVEGDMFENFKAECQNGLVNITWTTDGTDDESFKLEFSADSVNFNLIADSPLRTDVENNKKLSRLTLPATQAETKFFRLRRDFPGNAFMYSEAVKVSCVQNAAPETMIDVFPSGNGSYRVVIDSKIDDHFTIVMTDMNEVELVTDEFNVSKGMNQFTFKSGVMPKGNYNLKVTNGTNVIQKKVAIK